MSSSQNTEPDTSKSLFPTLEAASRIYDVPLNTLRWWIQTGKLGPRTGLCYIGKSAHVDARMFERALLHRRGPRRRTIIKARALALGRN